mmetsp:Transcript_1912/g.2127  ORF Transcript_1912/g.2127 Transcript_1912/m.2127 type:complete len:159 (-) Transcript_1912:120-596(-)|eukprot:CAMPEP_0197847140 /NCGR_PEP_ID=MMETSP1438-20131217/5276_1 /TAXON_ID=1461541 /ORGANISM="Pterosperma sp., Strain CCMP1384" /LENGTH=158 /DNA_ID=CAMNT_0043458977 /DNA_START=62 /DNA_END=538 /DNA_ORIENTATION=+
MASMMTVSTPVFKTSKVAQFKKNAVRTTPVCKTVTASKIEDFGKAALTFGATLALTASANAATIKLGSDAGELVFVPNSVTVKAGETITFQNNRGFPHNVVFDEDNVPDGVNADAISHEDYLNGPGEEVTNKFDTPGEYGYYCEPHQGAGMVGKIIVQ